MNDHSKDSQTRYLREAAIVLAKEGFQSDEIHADRLCIQLDGSPLCEVTETGGVAYRNEDIDEPERIAAKDKVYEIVKTTAEYKEYESLKSEVLKAIQGKSALPQDVLTEMLEDTRQKVLSTSERITTLTAELNDGNSKIEEMKAEFNRIVSWSKIFDESPMEVKKMICGYIIKKVSVFRDYRVKIEFNINVEQFLNGIDSIDECATYELPMAQ